MDTDSAFRHVNDSIRGLASEDVETETFGFLCECEDIGCHTFVHLTLREFDARRAASLPIVAEQEDGKPIRSYRPRRRNGRRRLKGAEGVS